MLNNYKRLFEISRPISWINTAVPFLVAFLISGSQEYLLVIFGVIFFLFPYNLAMYGINDIFDFESDSINPRKNSIEGAIVPKSDHALIWKGIAYACLPFIAYLLYQGSVASNVFLLFSIVTLVSYSLQGLRFKEIPFLDSVTSSTHFTNPLVFGLILFGGIQAVQLNLWSIAAFFIWGIASHALGAIQDIIPDREASIHSIGTALGAKATAIFCFSLYLLSAFLILFNFSSPLCFAAALALLPYCVISAVCIVLNDENSAEANRSWKAFLWINQLAGFSLTLTYLSYLEKLPWQIAVAGSILLATFAVALFFHRKK